MISETHEVDVVPIIFDTTVLRNFALAEVFYILESSYKGRAFICNAVLQEVQAGIECGQREPLLQSRTKLQIIKQAVDDGWLQFPSIGVNPALDIVELQLMNEYQQRFGKGESESMAVAGTRSWVFATDDKAARNFAKECGIEITGTLGILVKAVSSNILSLSDADVIHTFMKNEGYRSPLPDEYGISDYLNRQNQR